MTKKSWRDRRPDPQIRVYPSGPKPHAIVDSIDSYASAVVGAQPENFRELIGFAQELLPVASEACGVDEKDKTRTEDEARLDMRKVRDTLLLSAWCLTEMANKGNGENPIAFVQRAKQVIGWCQPKTSANTVLDHLENKARELARLIGERLFRHEGFILTIFDQGTEQNKGHSTWISSIDRKQAISVLAELVEHMRQDQASLS